MLVEVGVGTTLVAILYVQKLTVQVPQVEAVLHVFAEPSVVQ